MFPGGTLRDGTLWNRERGGLGWMQLSHWPEQHTGFTKVLLDQLQPHPASHFVGETWWVCLSGEFSAVQHLAAQVMELSLKP